MNVQGLVLTLRPATLEDADKLLVWRNEPDAVAMSKNQSTVTLDEHLSWLEDVFSGVVPVSIFILESEGASLGYVRIAHELNTGILSIALDRSVRGDGLSWQALDLAMGMARARYLYTLQATVKRDNLASRRLFSSHGFVIVNNPLEEWLEYELEL